MKTGPKRIPLIAAFLIVFGGLAPFAAMQGPAIGGVPLAVTITAAELLGAVLCGWAVLMWQGKL